MNDRPGGIGVRNILSAPRPGGGDATQGSESSLCLVETSRLKLERIISHAHATPAGEWYDQEQDEWVLILKGRAGLSFAGQERMVEMNPGDFIHIPAHVRHRVEWTDPQGQTVWLALHYAADDDVDAAAEMAAVIT